MTPATRRAATRELIEGRVFELRSRSTRYAPPCVLIVREQPRYGEPQAEEVDRVGVIKGSLYRHHHPTLYVPGFAGKNLTKRIARRRRDLERFDRYDLELIRGGLGPDFPGRIHGARYIPSTIPAPWTVLWLPAFAAGDFYWPSPRIDEHLRGAWHFTNHGGARHLGYKFGHMWATLHTGKRLRKIQDAVYRERPDVIVQDVKVVRWSDEKATYTTEVRRECPPLGMKCLHVDWLDGASIGVFA